MALTLVGTHAGSTPAQGHPERKEDVMDVKGAQALADRLEQEPECLDRHKGGCRGKVEYRLMPDRNDFKMFPRCEAHFETRLQEAERTLELLSDTRPAWFDEANAGERWEED
jgi:hypothetical protein